MISTIKEKKKAVNQEPIGIHYRCGQVFGTVEID